MFITSNAIRSITRKSTDRFRCISFCRENEKYIECLSKCNCDIYIVTRDGISGWKDSICSAPKNVSVLTKDLNSCGISYFDFIICNGRLQEFDMAYAISNALQIPIITVDHVSKDIFQKNPLNMDVNKDLQLEGRVGQINVALSDRIKQSWNTGTYGISITIPTFVKDSFDHNPKKTKDFIMDNNIPVEGLANIQGLLSQYNCQPRFYSDKREDIGEYRFYINTWNNIDNKTLEAMLARCIVLSPKTPDSEGIITHGENGLLFASPSELSELLAQCKSGKWKDIGEKARAYVLDNYPDEDEFCKKWDKVFSYASDSFFVRN
tara:strand:- start:2289 stop:3251 length:963 start_codon:yes stop_codon:yes gene_type:complete